MTTFRAFAAWQRRVIERRGAMLHDWPWASDSAGCSQHRLLQLHVVYQIKRRHVTQDALDHPRTFRFLGQASPRFGGGPASARQQARRQTPGSGLFQQKRHHTRLNWLPILVGVGLLGIGPTSAVPASNRGVAVAPLHLSSSTVVFLGLLRTPMNRHARSVQVWFYSRPSGAYCRTELAGSQISDWSIYKVR